MGDLQFVTKMFGLIKKLNTYLERNHNLYPFSLNQGDQIFGRLFILVS
jgi:hypothetical protein